MTTMSGGMNEVPCETECQFNVIIRLSQSLPNAALNMCVRKTYHMI